MAVLAMPIARLRDFAGSVAKGVMKRPAEKPAKASMPETYDQKYLLQGCWYGSVWEGRPGVGVVMISDSQAGAFQYACFF